MVAETLTRSGLELLDAKPQNNVMSHPPTGPSVDQF